MSRLLFAARSVPPHGPAFTVVLLVHVAAVLVAMVSLISGGVAALGLRRAAGDELPASVRRYFSPGVNWAGRTMYLVPAAGAGLIALSGGRDRWTYDWVIAGLVLWLVAALVAELLVWPAERRVQAALQAAAPGRSEPARSAASAIWRWSAVVFVILVAGTVLMFVRPH